MLPSQLALLQNLQAFKLIPSIISLASEICSEKHLVSSVPSFPAYFLVCFSLILLWISQTHTHKKRIRERAFLFYSLTMLRGQICTDLLRQKSRRRKDGISWIFAHYQRLSFKFYFLPFRFTNRVRPSCLSCFQWRPVLARSMRKCWHLIPKKCVDASSGIQILHSCINLPLENISFFPQLNFCPVSDPCFPGHVQCPAGTPSL